MFSIVYLPVNQAHAIVFGRDVLTASVLKVGTERECQDQLAQWEGRVMFTEAGERTLEVIRAAARARHARDRAEAKRRGRVDYPSLPYECSWAFENEFARRHPEHIRPNSE